MKMNQEFVDEHNGYFCPFCYRLYSNEEKNWIQHPQDILETVMHGKCWKKPSYQSVIERIFFQFLKQTQNISLCTDCSAFIRKNVLMRSEENAWKYHKKIDFVKHPMDVFVEYLISGTCTSKPCNSVVIHGLQSLCHKFPQNPMLTMEDETLYNLIGSTISFQKSFIIHANELTKHLVFIKWIWCGCPANMSNLKFAKKIRKYVGNFPGIYSWSKTTFPTACRFCCQSAKLSIQESDVKAVSDYRSSLMCTGKSLELKLQESIESFDCTFDYISFMCSKCFRISTLSHEYISFLYKFFNLDMKNIENLHFYYDNKIRFFEKKKSLIPCEDQEM